MKIVVVLVLVLAAGLFAVGAGYAFSQPRPKTSPDARTEGKSHERTSYESWLAGLGLPGGSGAALKKTTYQAGAPDEVIGKADGIRTVKFRLVTSDACDIELHYTDNAPHDATLGDQKAHLLRREDEGKSGDRRETTLVLLKTGGRLTFGPCSVHRTGACPGRIQVVR